MKQGFLRFPNGEWGVAVVWDYDVDEDYDVMYEQLRSFGLSTRKIEEALKVLSNLNTGMCVSNGTLKMSAIYIGDATSEEEWWNTAQHEIFHVVVHIIDSYNVPYDSEDAAYLAGFLTKQLIREVGEPCIY